MLKIFFFFVIPLKELLPTLSILLFWIDQLMLSSKEHSKNKGAFQKVQNEEKTATLQNTL